MPVARPSVLNEAPYNAHAPRGSQTPDMVRKKTDVMSRTFLCVIEELATTKPESPAFADENRGLTFASLRDAVLGLSANLERAGICEQSVVGISVKDELHHMVVCLAALTRGGAQIVLATHDSPQLRNELAQRAGVTHVICTDVRYALDGLDTLVLRELFPRNVPAGKSTTSAQQGTLYLTTSGTSGEPNIIPLTEEQLILQAPRHKAYEDQRLLHMASVEYNVGKRGRLHCLTQGGLNVFRPGHNSLLPAYCKNKGVCSIWLSPFHGRDFLNSCPPDTLSDMTIRMGGSAIKKDIRSRVMTTLSEHLFVVYGTTEIGTITVAGPGEHYSDQAVGRAVDGVQIEIVDNQDRPLPAGINGRIRVKKPGMATHYLGAKSSADARFYQGWFYPGDMGALEPDGVLLIMGREDDMLILNGINIFPIEIEQALERHPSVEAAAAFCVPSGVHGQIPIAAVELNERSASSEELQRFATDQLGLRAPRKVIIVAEGLPRNPQGKILKQEIAAAFEYGVTRT